MKTRAARLVALAALLGVAALRRAAALDAPHNGYDSALFVDCSSCHIAHTSASGALTTSVGNVNLCASCHASLPGVGVNRPHGFPWADADQAAPGSRGTSHSWSAAVQGNLGATSPGGPVGARLENGNLTCSACHDQHNNGNSAGAYQHTSYPIGVPQAPTNAGAGRTVSLQRPAAAAAAKGYLIDVVATGGVGVATYRLSNDGGTSWWGCSGPGAYVAYTGANACATAATVTLNDGTNVAVALSGSFTTGDQWKFYVSYPFLRIANGEGELCVACHQDRNMAATTAPATPGTTYLSHPVGAALARSYDRAPAAVLDANGVSTQAGPGNDGIATNDLRLSPTQKVTCLSCHSMHNADSNSMSVNPR